MPKSTPALIFIKTVFDVEKCLASASTCIEQNTGVSVMTHLNASDWALHS